MERPQDLGDGLLLRWGRPEDAEQVAAFNVAQHSDSEEEPELWLEEWTRDLMSGKHPTTDASDFTLVVDTKNGNKLVSTCCLISQTWAYAGIPFGCGRSELIATDPDYRRRGLVRQQMAAIHAKSVARGELMQAITGIPWFYRQFGYEMTLELHGNRQFSWATLGQNWSTREAKLFRMRTAVSADIPTLQTLYSSHNQPSLITVLRTPEQWQFAGFDASRESPDGLHLHVIETATGETAAFVEYQQWGRSYTVRELVVVPQFARREVAMFLLNWFKAAAERQNETREQPITHVGFAFGSEHWLYEAIESYLAPPRPPYAWYIRLPDLAAFLRHIAPALATRLASSAMRGYSGDLRLDFYRQQLELQFEAGELTAVQPPPADDQNDGDAAFPEKTFYHLLLGHRSLDEIRFMWPDCFARKPETAVLLNILFPKQPSHIRPLG